MYIVNYHYHNSVTLGRPGVILNMFSNKILKKKKKKASPVRYTYGEPVALERTLDDDEDGELKESEGSSEGHGQSEQLPKVLHREPGRLKDIPPC